NVAIFRYDVENGSQTQVPIAASSDKKMGTLSGDGNLITYSAINTGGWVYNFASGETDRFCQIASNTVVSDNGRFVACDSNRKSVLVKDLESAEIMTLDTLGSAFFGIGGVSNAGTVV